MAFNNLVDITRLQYFLEKLKALIPSASSAAPGKVASSSSQGSSVNYARQDHTHGIDLATGDSNGQVKIAGSNVSVKGLAALAYKASLGKSDVGLGNVDNVKQYSASNPPPYPVTSVNGSTGAVTVSVPSAATANPKMDGTVAVGSSAKYAKEDHVHPTDTSRAASVHTHSTQDLIRPSALRGLGDNTLQTLVSTTRANRLAFLPADQIIIEKTTDGGVTWVDAGVSDANKIALFSETRPSINLPLLNGVRSLLCGLRITITAMKYNVPSGTSETNKYNYWSETYVKSTERYCQLKELYFWLSSVSDTIGVKVERATGKAPNNWISIFDDSTFYMAGWSGCNYLRFGQNVFGGGTTQTTNSWNYRITLMTKGVNGTDTLATSYTTSAQSIMEIRGYGDTVWIVANQFMANDHLYNKDASQNATFPANVTASKFIGNLQGNADSATNASKVNNHTVNSDVPANAVFTDTTYESKAAASGGTAVSLVTTGEKYTWNNKGTYSKPSGGIPDSDIASAATWNAKGNGTITGITMNGASKGTSGVVNLGTVITAHQDISGKADKSATISNVAYDSTNKKLTKTINGTTSDVVTAATLKTEMALNNVENKSSATIRGELTKANVTTALGYTPPTTDTTYESKTAASGGTDVSLVTTGEKYTWNSKQAALVSGTNIKTINGSSLLGSGNLAVSGLPAVTSSDNDKVLKVVSGAWAAADNNGGQFIVIVQYLNGQYKSNKTHKQIMDAIDAGYTVVVRYDNAYYNLDVYVSSSKYVSFSQTRYLDSESSVLVRYFTMSGGDDVDTFTRYSNGVQKFTYPQNPNPICSVYYDNEQEKYVFDYEGKTDFSEVFATTGSIEGEPVLVWDEGYCDPLDSEQPDVYTKMFALTDAYTTNEDWTYTGHLVFSRIVDGTVPKIERFEISQDFDTYDTFASATVTYSEKPLGGSMPVNAAVIHVNAPLGSAITFFKGSTVMEAVTAAQTHPNADGKTEDYYYSVPTSDFGSWTVAASKSGENDATQSFSILVAKQYDSMLSYLAPYDFQAVEWLQTSTNVYFDTGIVPTTTNYMTKVSLQVAVTNGGSIFNVEGGYGMGKVGSYEQLYYYYVGGQAKLNVPGIATVGTDFDIIYNNDSGVVMINGVEVSANPNIQAINNRQYSILVSAERYGSTVSYYGTWRYKRFTVLERDTKNVLIDMHPCYRKIDNMPGFWDSVSNTFMTQLGTGIITVGPDV